MKLSAGERRAQANRDRRREEKSDVVARFLERTTDGLLLATFPNHFGIVSKGPIDLTHLDRYPNLRDAISFGYVFHCLEVDADRRYNVDQAIKSGFLAFLDDRKLSDIRLTDLSETTLRDFKAWMDDELSPGFAPSELTRRGKIQDIQLVIRQLMADANWAPRLSPDLKLLENLYPGAHRNVNHTDVLTDAQMEQLYIAALTECETTIRKVEDREAAFSNVLEAGAITEPENIDGDPLRCAAFLLHHYVDNVPALDEVVFRNPRRRKAINSALIARARAVLYPTLEEILPFVLLLALLLGFNPGVAMNMTLDDYVDDDTFAGRPRIRLFPGKPRKGGRHRNSVVKTEDFDNPARLLAFLEKRTERVRAVLENKAFADRVFIRLSTKFLVGKALEHSDKPWTDALKRFCARHSIEYFTLNQVRPTTLDLVHELTNDLLATQQFASHESPKTTHDFYTSTAMKQRNEEMLGGGINQLWRFMESGGKVDATERDRLNADLGAATPGFGCIDPYDSPIRGERKGALCAAYGRCPICEHAMIDTSSPHAYAYQRSLLERIDEAQTTLGPAWLQRWAPVKERLLTRCLSAFPKETILESGDVSIPPLPPLD